MTDLKRESIPEIVDDDHFTWWFDDLMCSPGNDNKMTTYEVAALAWHEAVKRIMGEL